MYRPFALALLLLTALPSALPAAGLTPLERLAERTAEVLRLQHKKARKALVNAAQDRAFVDYFTSSDEAERRQRKERIDHIALSVQAQFHTEEMCLIDTRGREVSRIVGSAVATDLDDDERHAPFFAPGFASRPRTVLVTPPYLSDDAHKWVIAYVTPIAHDDRHYAILHYEHGLDVFQRLVARGQDDPHRFVLLLDDTHHVLADSRRSIPIAARGARRDADAYFPRFEFEGLDLAALHLALARTASIASGDGDRCAVAESHVDDWTVLAFECGRAKHT